MGGHRLEELEMIRAEAKRVQRSARLLAQMAARLIEREVAETPQPEEAQDERDHST